MQNMVVTGSLTGLAITKLFVAGIVPGILMGLSQMVVCYIIATKRNYPKHARCGWKERMAAFKNAFWALLMTFIILYGIMGGICTPTEASMIAVVYALVIGLFVYRELPLKKIPVVIRDSACMTASILMLIGFANAFAWVLSREQVPQLVANGMLNITHNKIVILLLINILLLFVGTFMETNAALAILFPTLLSVATQVGVNPIQFGIIVVLNLVIGLTTPPVGVCLFDNV